MKRIVLVLMGISLYLPLFAQYDFTVSFREKDVVSAANPRFHKYSFILKNAPNPHTGGNVFFLVTKTSSLVDDSKFRLHLGDDSESSLLTIRNLRSFLRNDVGTIDTIGNYGIVCGLRIVIKGDGNKLLEMRNSTQVGKVYVCDQLLAIFEDALKNWDDEVESSFADRSSGAMENVKSEISRYRGYLNFWGAQYADYTSGYRKLFRQRIKKYRESL